MMKVKLPKEVLNYLKTNGNLYWDKPGRDKYLTFPKITFYEKYSLFGSDLYICAENEIPKYLKDAEKATN